MSYAETIESFRADKKRVIRALDENEKESLGAWAESNPFRAGLVDGAYINLNLPLLIYKFARGEKSLSQKAPLMREAEFIREHSGAYAIASKNITYDRLHALGRVAGFFFAGWITGKMGGAALTVATSTW